MAAFFLPNTWTDWIADMLSVVRSRRFVYLRDRGGLLPLLDGVDGVGGLLRSRRCDGGGTSVSPSVRPASLVCADVLSSRWCHFFALRGLS